MISIFWVWNNFYHKLQAYNAGNNANKPPKQQVQQQYKGFFNSIPSAADMGDASRYRQLYQPPRERVITPNLVPYNNRGKIYTLQKTCPCNHIHQSEAHLEVAQ